MNHEERTACVAQALASHDPSHDETRAQPWKGATTLLPVVHLPLACVVLNPRSHRIRAQLEDHPERSVVQKDPWSDDAQRVIADVLGSLGALRNRFDDLLDNLREEGQKNEGLVTRSGLLVNANRRAVALRKLGEQFIKVMVLPEDASERELDDLELQLQMQRDFREDYTYTNRLLFVDELLGKQGRRIDEVARALNLAVASDSRALEKGRQQVERDTRVLSLLRDVQRRSENRLPLTSFDAQEIALEELDDRRRELAASGAGAESDLVEVRLLGLLTDVPYRDLRRLDGEVLEAHIMPALHDNPLLVEVIEHLASGPAEDTEAPSASAPSGLEMLDDEPVASIGQRAAPIAALNDLLSRSHGQEVLLVPGSAGPRRLDRRPVVEAVEASLRAAAHDIKEYAADENQLVAPISRLLDAERKIRAAAEGLPLIVERPDFDKTAVVAALERVLTQLRLAADAAEYDLGL